VRGLTASAEHCHRRHLYLASWVDETRGAVMKVFVAGTTGALGTELVPKLVARGHDRDDQGPVEQDELRALGGEPGRGRRSRPRRGRPRAPPAFAARFVEPRNVARREARAQSFVQGDAPPRRLHAFTHDVTTSTGRRVLYDTGRPGHHAVLRSKRQHFCTCCSRCSRCCRLSRCSRVGVEAGRFRPVRRVWSHPRFGFGSVERDA
jgi:hypothetical protein